MVTLKDIAKRTKLDISTISRSLNNSPRVKTSTKEYVQKTARKMGYKKNEIARSLATRKTNTIGVIFSDVASPFFSELIKGIEQEANKNLYSIFLCDADWDLKKEANYLEMLASRKVDGLLVHTSYNLKEDFNKTYKDIDIPFVLLADFFDGLDYYSVGIDNYKGAYEVTSYLLSLGHRDILHVTDEIYTKRKNYKLLIDRLDGYKKALKDSGIKFRKELVVAGPSDFPGIRKNVSRVLSENNKITSVFASSDWFAIAAIKAVQDIGKKVPLDYSVAGFDNIIISSVFNPSLTTYDQPKYLIGTKAVQMLLELLEGRIPEKKNYLIESKGLIKRRSCAEYK